MPSAPGITFDVRPSRLLTAGMAAMVLLACIAVTLSRASFWLQVVACVLIIMYAVHAAWRLHRIPVCMAGWHADGTWTLHLHGGDQATARLHSGHRLGPAIFLVWSSARIGRTSLVLLPDNADADTRRRLRMRLSALSDTD